MDIQTRKIEFILKFLKLQKEEDISEFEKLMKRTSNAGTNEELKSFSVEELHKRIAKSEADFKNGDYKTTDELLAKY